MIVLTAAINYGRMEVEAFHHSLMDSGFSGKLVVLVNSSRAADYFTKAGAELIEDQPSHFHINTRRFLAFKNYLRDKPEPALICDVRDVIFQHNPEHGLPQEGVNVFCEWEGITIGKCPYNSKWMRQIFQEVKWSHMPIICAGVTCGILTEYTHVMWEALRTLPPIVGFDQAIHNHLIYSGRIPAKVYPNEDGPVYTVGYIPRETIPLHDGMIHNRAGLPCVVHQYDRHQNLRKGVTWVR